MIAQSAQMVSYVTVEVLLTMKKIVKAAIIVQQEIILRFHALKASIAH